MVEFYCRKHNVAACGACVVIDHTSCQPEYIPDISLEYQTNADFRDFLTNKERLLKHVTEFLLCTEADVKRTKENGQHLITDFKRYREDIKKYLDRKEKELEAETEQQKKDDLSKLRHISGDIDEYKTKLTEAKSHISKLEGHDSDLFITSTDMIARVKYIQARVSRAHTENKTYIYRFIKSDVANDLLTANNGFGVVTKGEPIQNAPQPLEVGILARVAHETR